MEDSAIIDLYFQRQEQAIQETASKYGSFLTSLAWNILRSHPDAEECVNDTYLRTWNAIPSQRPNAFQLWLGRITRNLSLDRFRALRSAKRGGEAMDVLLGELDTCLPDPKQVEHHLEEEALAALISAFLRRQSKENRTVFLRRYWYGQSIAEIAAALHCGEGRVKSALFRTRAALRKELEQEGIVC